MLSLFQLNPDLCSKNRFEHYLTENYWVLYIFVPNCSEENIE